MMTVFDHENDVTLRVGDWITFKLPATGDVSERLCTRKITKFNNSGHPCVECSGGDFFTVDLDMILHVSPVVTIK